MEIKAEITSKVDWEPNGDQRTVALLRLILVIPNCLGTLVIRGARLMEDLKENQYWLRLPRTKYSDGKYQNVMSVSKQIGLAMKSAAIEAYKAYEINSPDSDFEEVG
jgi:DNA-binding cell septation regulator SpoVG